MPNRVTTAIERMQANIQQRLQSGATTKAKLAATSRALDITDLREYAYFQEIKTLAATNGKLTLEEAQTIYVYLGNSPSTFNRQSVAVKAVLTQIFTELLQARITTTPATPANT